VQITIAVIEHVAVSLARALGPPRVASGKQPRSQASVRQRQPVQVPQPRQERSPSPPQREQEREQGRAA
jgi:hypothetical protein